MTFKKTVKGEGIRQAKLFISKQLSEAWLVELKKFDSKRLRLVVTDTGELITISLKCVSVGGLQMLPRQEDNDRAPPI